MVTDYYVAIIKRMGIKYHHFQNYRATKIQTNNPQPHNHTVTIPLKGSYSKQNQRINYSQVWSTVRIYKQHYQCQCNVTNLQLIKQLTKLQLNYSLDINNEATIM